jgi:anti-sigma regulatory factor (Ser/Thr protein kinase)
MLASSPFRHEALLYAGRGDFVTTTALLIRGALRDNQPVFVMVRPERIDWLRQALGDDADGAAFANMSEIGRNPSRIIPAWGKFIENTAGGGRRLGIGEPIWADRSPAELIECQTHEMLLNNVCAEASNFRLVCPYDATALAPDVLAEMRRSHPIIVEDGLDRESDTYSDQPEAFGPPLPAPTGSVSTIAFGDGDLDAVRRFVARLAIDAGVDAARTSDLQLAVSEIATNSLRHGGGRGTLNVWEGSGALVCEVVDTGRVESPLVGRAEPPADLDSPRGIWVVHQVCDLVQIRSGLDGTVVRLHMQQG